jgi:hypothetical protein
MTSGRYFNKGVMALDVPDIGHVVRETETRSLYLVKEKIDMISKNQKFNSLAEMC